jgi:hypothetical protein
VPHKDASKRVEYQKQYRRKHAARLKELNTAWRHNNTDRINRNLRKNAYRRLYGFTIEQYDELLAAQGGVCALCGRDKPWGRGKYFHVDHDHVTGHVRGLLCNRCNSNLGWMEARLNTVVLYLTVPPPPGSKPTDYLKRNPTVPREGSRARALPREKPALSFPF